MKTLIQLNELKEPVSVYVDYVAATNFVVPENCIAADDLGPIDPMEILREWRFKSGQFVKVGPPPNSYYRWSTVSNSWFDPRTSETEWPLVRAERDRLLLASDWTQLPDVHLATKEVWATYRQALRDVTLQPDPFNIVWPTPPN